MAFKPFDLAGKVALVTGGNGGIGLGMAEGLAQAGADVVIWGTNPDKNERAISRLAEYGTRVSAQLVDVSDEQRVNAAMDELMEVYGRIDTCIANAGIGARTAPFHEISSEAWRQVMSVNLEGKFYTLRAAARHMVARAKEGDTGGSLVAISSTSVLMGASHNEHYGAANGGVIPMMKGLAVEYGRYNIRANTIIPGWTMTDLARPVLESEGFVKKVLPRQPGRRWGRPEDFAGIAIYLASDASSFHTGQEFTICGGYTVF
jgi:NAD(P)-dependent dehydrogenase (short-subunit alcohol dehydrogenase family)